MSEPLVIVGNGMAAARLVDELGKTALGRYAIAVIGDEPRLAYNRVLLSSVLAGETASHDIELRPASWWRDRGVTLKYGCIATEIDVGRRELKIAGEESLTFSRLVLATGSTPLRLNVPGAELAGVHTFRDSRDVDLLLTLAAQRKRVVVVGGGLLGLEAAYGLAKAGASVTLVHLMDRLMERQLDAPAAQLLKSLVERKGIKILLDANTAALHGETRVEALELSDGRVLDADAVIFAAGIRPNVALAREAGIPVNRGIVVDDHLQTGAPDIYAIGECAEHRGVCYGLVEPAYEQARVLARHLAGGAVGYNGSVVSTNLKVSGVSVFSAGDFIGAEGSESVVLDDARHGTYKKLVISEGRLTGAVLVGDVGDALWYLELIRERAPVAAIRSDMMFGRSMAITPRRPDPMTPVVQMTSVGPTLRATRTACPYCGVGCGVLATADGNGGAAISGDPDHPANFGRLCSKGSALGETLALEDRLLYPMIRCSKGTMEQVAWSDALDHVAHRFAHIIKRDGPDAVAFYLSGQLLTEDYYVANKLMKGFIGSANVDTNSRLCMASSVAGHRRAFGADTVPGCYEDLDQADLLVLVGSNAAWCHPVLYQRMLANKQARGARMVVVDPRRTDTAGDADLFLGLKPGTDTALFCGLLVYLADNGALDRGYIEAHTSGFDEALARARSIAGSLGATALATGLAESDVAAFFQMFRNTPRAVTLYSQGVNQSAQGTDKVNAIINCHLATARIGKPGASPFSLTGQPNAMGGREVGGLANQLAAHMGFTPPDIDRVRRFWKAPDIATHEGLKAVQMFEAIARGEIKALWVIGTNPAVSLPDADAARAALGKLELLVISENVRSNDTVNSGAHVLLPAQAWGEKSGTVTNSERRISRQRAFLVPPGEAKPDWWIVSEVAKRLGFGAGFDFNSAADVFREHAALSAFENDGRRDFDIGALQAISDEAFDAMAPVLWPARSGDAVPQPRFFAEGGFFSNDRKARFVAPEVPVLRTETTAGRPLRLNTGRIRDQWHTMTRSGQSPRLGQHLPEPYVEVHPDDALRFGLFDGGFARVTTDYGQCTLKVAVSERQQRGMLFAPIHWSEETSSAARVGALVAPFTDPFSGQPENKATPASIAPYEYVFRGFALSRTPLQLPAHALWTRVAVNGGHGYLLADNADLASWQSWLRSVAGDELAEYRDFGGGIFRAASFAEGRIETCLFLGPARDAGDWNVVKGLFAGGPLDDAQRRMLLSGKSADGLASAGPIVCACFGVGRTTICDAIAAGADSAAAIGVQLKAGTNCGSCLPELKRLVAQVSATSGLEPHPARVAN